MGPEMQSVLKFYADVYQSEMSNMKMLHMDSNRLVRRFFLDGKEELASLDHPLIPISANKGEEMLKTLSLRSHEVELKYFFLFRHSSFLSIGSNEVRNLYPLISFDAEITEKEGNYYVQIDPQSRKLIRNNLPVKVMRHEEVKKAVAMEETDMHFAARLKSAIDDISPESVTDDLLDIPELWPIKKINKENRKKFRVQDKYIPAAAIAIVEVENNSFTTLDELGKLGEADRLSAPFRYLFEVDKINKSDKRGVLCEELNSSQLKAIDNSNSRTVSVISGPPGTGKSFTIANIAAEKVSKGQTVLITSKNREALEVIEDKITEGLGLENLCVNPSKDPSFRQLKEFLSQMLKLKTGKRVRPSESLKEIEEFIGLSHIEKLYHEIDEVHERHLLFEKNIRNSFKLERDFINQINSNDFTKDTSDLFKDRILEKRSSVTIPLWEKLEAYYEGIDHLRMKANEAIKAVINFRHEHSLMFHRTDLKTYLYYLRARDKQRKAQLETEIDLGVIIRTFPVWLIRANEVSKIISPTTELFDVLIIDEASQCDIPSVLPLIQRAKKCIIVGDSKQLNHVSFLTTAFENSSRRQVIQEKQHLCHHRNYSILTLAEEVLDPMDVVQLNEHFRSQFELIEFSNRQFYSSKLDILTKRPLSMVKNAEFVQTKGRRLRSINQDEIDQILADVKKTIDKEHDLADQYKSTIGILSPFRKQVDKIISLLHKELTLEQLVAHKILVGTAFTFQGNERDVMYLSMVLDNKSLAGSFNFLNRKDVFNVSVTRARNKQIIYYSFNPEKLSPKSTLASFFDFYSRDREELKGRNTKDRFCDEVEQFMKELGCKSWRSFEISGVTIDLLVAKDNAYYGIDLIGFPGEMEDYYSLERYKTLERGKVKLFPLSYILWSKQEDKCKAALGDLVK